MAKANINDLSAFVAVARQRSFTRAAANLGVSQSALSHTIRGLEARLGVRLLTRTTRNVTTTEAGERLLLTIGPRLDEIDAELAALSELRDRPAGNFRITATEHAAATVILPALRRLLPAHPDINVEVVVDYGLTDIVAERYDAGIRFGGTVAKDMIAVQVGPDLRMMAAASPAYFEGRPKPRTPQDLTAHNCINMRLPTYGALYAWEFDDKDGRELRVRVEGQLVFNSGGLIIEAALKGMGIACLPDAMLTEYVERGELEPVLTDWCAPFAGYHLYYPSRRQQTPAFALLVEAMRYRG
ncbi:LysR family transcriptional regulator [Caulobacter sp. NIBR2454]|uniref:LysR family transcriptional regulator n=1 Tax=Caulobacter sp. NIBR2454 TaxID=3015996 RepID=UPI0022B65D89|nr:LysR family transcriptional regulator [Caulobacter sp. NIBR2454]